METHQCIPSGRPKSLTKGGRGSGSSKDRPKGAKKGSNKSTGGVSQPPYRGAKDALGTVVAVCGAALQSIVRKLWQTMRDALTRRIRYKITRGGLLFTFAIAMVAFGAIVSANNLLFLIVATMMATLLISGLVSRLCLAELNLDFFVPDHVPAGRTVPGKLFVRNDKWFIPSFSLRVEAIRDPASPILKSGVYFPLIASGTTLEETVEVRFPRRGRYQQ